MGGVRLISGWTAAVLGACGALPVLAAEPPSISPELIKALDSSSLKEREEATQLIGEGEPMARLGGVEQALRDPSLSAEQRERLRAAGLRLFAGTPRGAMGVRIQSTVGDGIVTISPSTPGFDAMRVLRDGDVVKSADGHPITTELDLRSAIVSHDPGEEVTLGIVRSGEPMTVKIKLGRFSDLGQGSMMDDRIIIGAWDRRSERVSPAPEPPLAGDLSAERWSAAVERARATRSQRAEPMTDPSSQEPVRSPLFRPPAATLSAGGQARDPGTKVDSVALGQRQGQFLIDAASRNVRLRDEAGQIMVERAQISAAMENLETQLSRAGITAEQRQQCQAEFDRLRARQQVLDQRFAEISRQLGR